MTEEKDQKVEEKKEEEPKSDQADKKEISEKVTVEKAESPKPEGKKSEEKKEKPAPPGKFKDLIKQIEELSVLELSELVKALEDRFGVSAAAPIAVGAVSVSGGEGAEVEEKSEFDVMLTSVGDKKIQVIKAVREVKPDLGLKEAKDLVDSAPKELAKGMKKEEAEEAKKKLEAAGASVELK